MGIYIDFFEFSYFLASGTQRAFFKKKFLDMSLGMRVPNLSFSWVLVWFRGENSAGNPRNAAIFQGDRISVIFLIKKFVCMFEGSVYTLTYFKSR